MRFEAAKRVLDRAIEQGEICLSDPMSRFYGRLSREAGRITVFHLLTHTSGIAPLTSCVGAPRERAAEEILARPLAYETGTRVGFGFFRRTCP